MAADVLYLRDNVAALLCVLPLLARGGEVLLADPGRAGARDFLAAARHLFALETWRDPERERVSVHTLRPRPPD